MSPGFKIPEELQAEAARLADAYGTTADVSIRYWATENGFYFVFPMDGSSDHLIDGAYHPMRRLTVDEVLLVVLAALRGGA